MQLTVRFISEVESIFTSVERLVYYIMNLKQEAPSSIPDKKPADDWPTEGDLSIVGLKVRKLFHISSLQFKRHKLVLFNTVGAARVSHRVFCIQLCKIYIYLKCLCNEISPRRFIVSV